LQVERKREAIVRLEEILGRAADGNTEAEGETAGAKEKGSAS
jgi:hypothetical protein